MDGRELVERLLEYAKLRLHLEGTDEAYLAREQDGCIGARMIGAGFGGCTISIVEKDKAEAFKKAVGQAYEREIGYAASFYETSIEDGVTVRAL